jgi:hypothetical protein
MNFIRSLVNNEIVNLDLVITLSKYEEDYPLPWRIEFEFSTTITKWRYETKEERDANYSWILQNFCKTIPEMRKV